MLPLAFWVPLNVPAEVLDAEAVQELAYAEVHIKFTLCPRLIVIALAGLENDTVGMMLPEPPLP
jgi:hypothetical protein